MNLRAALGFLFQNSSRFHLRVTNKKFAEAMVPGGYVLDAGAGEGPYRSLFDHMHYESTDFNKVPGKVYTGSTFICDLCENIPVENERYDYVVCNQVLEHLPRPQAALNELARVLKPGGGILCSAPFFFEEHEKPYDYFRYTQFAYTNMFGKAGLEIEKIEWLEGYFGTTGYMLRCIAKYLPLLPRGGDLPSKLILIVAWPVICYTKLTSTLLAIVFDWLDMRAKVSQGGFPKNYVVTAKKLGAPT